MSIRKYASEDWVKEQLANVGGGVTSWNDLEDRPFYIIEESGESTYVEILPQMTVELEDWDDGIYGFDTYDFIVSSVLVEGQTYSVEWDGKLYDNLVCFMDGEDYYTIGSPYEQLESGGGEYPFNIYTFNTYSGSFTFGVRIKDTNTSSHTIKITQPNTSSYKPEMYVDPKYLQYLQADWNQNDESALDFIKNKPFGDFKTTKLNQIGLIHVDFYGAQTVELPNPNGILMPVIKISSVEFGKDLSAEKKYTIILNNVEYSNLSCVEYTCEESGNSYTRWSIGCHSLDYSNSDIPFTIIVTDYEGYKPSMIVVSREMPATTLKAYIYEQEYETVIKKLDSKYLPDDIGGNVEVTPGKFTEGTVYTINDNEVTAQTGAEIFNDYENNIATGKYSHAEGSQTQATGSYSHTEGYGTIASGWNSHAEGNSTKATNSNTHAEGQDSEATGDTSHAEGRNTKASGNYAHAEGYYTQAGNYAHAEGSNTKALEPYSHAEGSYSETTGSYAHAEGYRTVASSYGHAEGNESKATGNTSHAEGNNTEASGMYSHTEGSYTKATNSSAHAEGDSTEASGSNSHAEGRSSKATSGNTHAEGYYTEASGYQAHAEGNNTKATNENTHAEGYFTTASGSNSHAEGNYTEAKGYTSHAEGYYTIASGSYQHVQGKNNIEDTENKYAHIVGNGAYSGERSNAHTVDWDGNAWYAGDVYVGGTSQDNASKLATEEFVLNNSGGDTSVQSDWNENDDNNTAYIKNRPFWSEAKIILKDKMSTKLPDTDEGAFAILELIEGIEIDERYIVTYNGINYECIANTFDSGDGVVFTSLGDSGLLNGEVGAIPFFMLITLQEQYSNIGVGAIIMDPVGLIPPTISIETAGNIHRLDNKYLDIFEDNLINIAKEKIVTNNVNVSETGGGFSDLTKNDVYVGQELIVFIDGNKYNMIVENNDSLGLSAGVAIGNVTILLQFYDSKTIIVVDDGTGNLETPHTASVWVNKGKLNTIDPKYLPEGIGSGVTSWNDLADRPFYDNSEIIFEWNGDINGIDPVIGSDYSYYRISDAIPVEDIIGATIHFSNGEEIYIDSVNDFNYYVENNTWRIFVDDAQLINIQDTSTDIFTETGLYSTNPDNYPYLTKISKGNIVKLDPKYVPYRSYKDNYTVNEIEILPLTEFVMSEDFYVFNNDNTDHLNVPRLQDGQIVTVFVDDNRYDLSVHNQNSYPGVTFNLGKDIDITFFARENVTISESYFPANQPSQLVDGKPHTIKITVSLKEYEVLPKESKRTFYIDLFQQDVYRINATIEDIQYAISNDYDVIMIDHAGGYFMPLYHYIQHSNTAVFMYKEVYESSGCIYSDNHYYVIDDNSKVAKNYFCTESFDAKTGIIGGNGIVLLSPNGTRFALTVGNDGVLSTTEMEIDE